MKRSMIGILLITVFLSLAACSGNNDASAVTPAPTGVSAVTPAPTGAGAAADKTPETTVPTAAAASQQPAEMHYVVDFNTSENPAMRSIIFETESAFYYLCANSLSEYMVYFSDKEYKEWMPLCSRPDCHHRDYNCNAYLEGDCALRMWLYNDHLYYIIWDNLHSDDRPALWRMRLDGSAHEKLCTVPDPGGGRTLFTFETWTWFFHNKYAFISFGGEIPLDLDASDGEVAVITARYCIDLSDETWEPREYPLTDSYGKDSGFSYVLIGQGDIMYSYDQDNGYLCRVDIPAGTKTNICKLDFEFGSKYCALEGDCLYICQGYTAGIAACVHLDTGEVEVLNEFEPQTRNLYKMGGGYVFGGAITYDSVYKGTPISDYSGELIQLIPDTDGSTRIGVVSVLGNYVFGISMTEGNSLPASYPPDYYLDIRDIGTDRLAWRKWEP